MGHGRSRPKYTHRLNERHDAVEGSIIKTIMNAAVGGQGAQPDLDFQPDFVPQPTKFLPGTPEKLEVLAQRAANNEVLFHPMDAEAPRNGEYDDVDHAARIFRSAFSEDI